MNHRRRHNTPSQGRCPRTPAKGTKPLWNPIPTGIFAFIFRITRGPNPGRSGGASQRKSPEDWGLFPTPPKGLSPFGIPFRRESLFLSTESPGGPTPVDPGERLSANRRKIGGALPYPVKGTKPLWNPIPAGIFAFVYRITRGPNPGRSAGTTPRTIAHMIGGASLSPPKGLSPFGIPFQQESLLLSTESPGGPTPVDPQEQPRAQSLT